MKKVYTRCWWIIFIGFIALESLALATEAPGPVLLALALLVEAAVIALYLHQTKGMEMTGQKARYFNYTASIAVMLLMPKNAQPRSIQWFVHGLTVLQLVVLFFYDRRKARCPVCQARLPLFGDSHRCLQCQAVFGEEP